MKTNPRAKHFRTMYVDAFAGTGKMEYLPTNQAALFEQPRIELKGSAARALEVSPEFDKYVFIELNSARFQELSKLKKKFPAKAGRIEVHNEEANRFLQQLCATTEWRRWRAVVILDPFAMNVSWSTVESLAQTRAVDMWWLFPCGAFNRLLTRDKKPPEKWSAAVTRICGTTEWLSRFYEPRVQSGLFGAMSSENKIIGFEGISEFLLERLSSVFAKVVKKPLVLVNSHNSPIFMLFFAAGNPTGAPTAVKIANSVIQHSGNKN
jgi:three-Cys-motif partner protein